MRLVKKLYKHTDMLHTRTSTALAAAMQGDVANDDLTKLKIVEKLSQLSDLVYKYGLEAVRDKVKANLVHESFHESMLYARRSPTLKKNGWRWKMLFPNGDSDKGVDESSMDISRWAILARYAPKDCENFDWDRALTDSDIDWRHDIMRIRTARNDLAHRTDNNGGEYQLHQINERLKDVERALIRLGVPNNILHDIRHQKTMSAYLAYEHTNFLVTVNTGSESFPYMLRGGWKAEPRKADMTELQLPVRYVVISHTCGEPCDSTESCCANVLSTQRYHINERKFSDIGFNFLIGNDGIVYEGRGFDWQGAFAYLWNKVSIGIAFIGIYTGPTLPSDKALKVLEQLLRYLVNKNVLCEDYTVYALKQIRPFPDAPGDGLYALMQTWPHWQEYKNVDL